jgi:nitroimidazol reductase NimA-like FMN-containing flavoprotein (pyridoxamine 5'-phosphate oxidase superfamily)
MTTPREPSPDLVATVEDLPEPECWNLLAGAQVGRVGLIVDGKVEILPVNYALDGRSILFRTAEGTVLNQASMAEVAFEVDRIDETTQEGSSVLVHGLARDLGDAIGADAERIRRLSLVTWAPGARPRWIQIEPDRVTGRRIRVLPAAL